METTQLNDASEVKSDDNNSFSSSSEVIKPINLPEIYHKNAIELMESRFGFKDCKMTIQPGSVAGDNYVGIVYRIVATDNVTGQSRHMILKVPPQNAARRQEFNCRLCFLREIKAYDEILIKFRHFEESKGIISGEEGFSEYAECYRTMSDDPYEGLFFQDLKQTGFEMLSRFVEPTLDYARLLMQALGKFHAISFAMKDQASDELMQYKDMKDIMREMYGHDNMVHYLHELNSRALGTLDSEKDSVVLEKCKRIFETPPVELLEYLVNGNLMEKYAVICHGDCWNNNMLFRCDENGKPIEIRLIDFQIVRYSSPALDLAYYIFCSTHKTLRENHYEEMLQIYHKSLAQHLTRLGSDAEKIFPYSALKSELKRVGRFGLVMAVMLLPVVIEAAENIMDLDEIAEKIKNGEMIEQPTMVEATQQKFNKRMRDVLVDMERYGYLD